MIEQNLDLFRELGAWVRIARGEHQRWYATACHRHAWHADLWAQRCPAIEPAEVDAASSEPRRALLPAAPDTPTYRSLLSGMLAELDGMTTRVDRNLDPSTDRVLTLVRRDLADLIDLIDLAG